MEHVVFTKSWLIVSFVHDYFLGFIECSTSSQIICSNANLQISSCSTGQTWTNIYPNWLNEVCPQPDLLFVYLQWLAVSIHLSEMITHPQKWLRKTCNEHWNGAAPSSASCPPTIRPDDISGGKTKRIEPHKIENAFIIILCWIGRLTYMIGDIETTDRVQHTAQNEHLKFHLFFRLQI